MRGIWRRGGWGRGWGRRRIEGDGDEAGFVVRGRVEEC